MTVTPTLFDPLETARDRRIEVEPPAVRSSATSVAAARSVAQRDALAARLAECERLNGELAERVAKQAELLATQAERE